ncbi:probable GTPase-activating protein GYP5 [Rhynchosporium secalis]|uniref:GTPase-activating protein GYP5 n=1 Tax=Rhynchosporium secalis TaxID=38038 RepID=A0A1E1M4C6_RHYSE|nr:probable GTPase-activating protein GYP5 [Rhynchosporium secalis]
MSEHENKEKEEPILVEVKEQTRRNSNADSSDRETDTFEDATDTTELEAPKRPSMERTRSLTKRPSFATSRSNSQEKSDKDQPPVTAVPTTESKEDMPNGNEDIKQPNSPLLTSHRVSTTSSLDNANLDTVSLESEELTPVKPVTSRESVKGPPLPSKNAKPALQGLSGALPSVPWSAPPPPAPVQSHAPPPAAPPTRKLTSPFSWLSRNTSQKEAPPPLPSADRNGTRRNTASSIATISSNPEMMLSKLEEGDEGNVTGANGRPARNSLRDRFKLLRMREEAGITALPDDDKSGGGFTGMLSRTATFSIGGLTSPAVDDHHATSPSSPHPPPSPNPTTVNPALAPGTASGVSAGPSAGGEDVDWDLWQAVVDEGPAAVARTSPEELNRAITTGIPNAIRGVVWQILAQSKNEELESVYRDLVNRGTEKDKDRLSGSSASTSLNGRDDVVVSSASSIRSDHSTPGTTSTNGMRSPSPPKDPEMLAKAHAVTLADKKKKAKEDAAALLKLDKAIKRDLGARTSFSKFAASSGLQEGLFGVCRAYALFDEGVGYAQGMNFLAMPLLFNMPEEEAFCLLVRLMNQYHLRDLFKADMPGLHMHLYQFERLLEDFEPALYCHLHRRQVTPHLYATQWFLTLFAYRFPLQLVLRIYDLILSEGLEAIIKFGIVLMQKNAAALLGMTDMVALTNFLKDKVFDVYIDQAPSAGSILESGFFGSSGASIDKEVYRADQLIQDACSVKITPEILKTYRQEWEEKTRLEKERETEFETLKSHNASLSQKVRRLEERVEEHDSEHAALATDLVKTMVENQELKDENESLKGQVVELRAVIEKQPEEVEQRLQSEMDRLMKRNQEVHEENSRLEEEMGEMEQTLVATKMQYAEINAAHETLTRKWTDLRKALGD